jgi:hypothetical protein
MVFIRPIFSGWRGQRDGSMSIVYEDQGNNCDHIDAWRLAAAHLRDLLAAG